VLRNGRQVDPLSFIGRHWASLAPRGHRARFCTNTAGSTRRAARAAVRACSASSSWIPPP